MKHTIITLLCCLTAATASAAMQSSVTQYGITWTFDGDYEVGQYANGDYWVLGPVTITAMTPDFAGGRNGWEQDPSQTATQPYDSRAPGYDAAGIPSLPVTVTGTSSILKTVSGDLTNSSCRPCLRTAAVLTVVDAVPADAGSTLFRPGYFGTDKRSFSVSQLRTDLLPAVTPPPLTPDMTETAAKFQRVQLDHKFESTCRHIHPSENLPDYGSDIAIRNAEGVLRLMLDDPLADKMPLLVNMVQFGIDLHAMYEGGQYWKGNGGHMEGRKLPAAFAAAILDDADMKDAVRNADIFDFGENHGAYHSEKAGRILYGQLPQSEHFYWMNATVDVGSRTIRDPYGWVDGGREPGGSYQLCCLSQPWLAQVAPTCIMPELRDVWNDTTLLAYVDRWVAVGTWTAGDPCAPAPAFDQSGDRRALYENTKVDSGYGITWGPAPGNAPDCHLTSSCDCIRDTDTSDGTGRWPERHGIEKNGGSYSSSFAKFMFGWYRDHIPVSSAGTPAAGISASLPSLPNPVSFAWLITRYPDAQVFDLDGTRITLSRVGLALVRIPGYGMSAVLIRE